MTVRLFESVRSRYMVAAIILCTLFLVAATVASAASPGVTKGIIPSEAFQPGGSLDMSLVPDFVATSDQEGNVVGYSSKWALLPQQLADGVLQPAPTLVYGEDLKTIVGYMYPSKGFVPVGVDPATVPGIPAEVGPADVATP
jgi:hypothetical protein